VPLDDLVQRPEARRRALLVDEEGRVDLARGIVHGHDQVDLPLERGQPQMARAVLVQHHPDHRPARPLLAMRRALDRRAPQAGRCQHALRPAIACGKPMPLGRPLVKMFRRPPGVPIPVQRHNPIDLIRYNPVRAYLAKPAVEQTSLTLRRKPTVYPAKLPLAQPQRLRRFNQAQPTPHVTIVNLQKPHLPDLS
jgi:hypothetical protein